jgi:hypothetical protein
MIYSIPRLIALWFAGYPKAAMQAGFWHNVLIYPTFTKKRIKR